MKPVKDTAHLLPARWIVLGFFLTTAAAAQPVVRSQPATSTTASRPAQTRPVFRLSTRPASGPALSATKPATQPVLNRDIRVRLLRDVSVALIETSGRLRFQDADSGQVLGDLESGQVGPAVFEAGATRFPELGAAFAAPAIELVPLDGEEIGFSRDGRTLWFPGRLRLVRSNGSAGVVINVLDIEDYLSIVVAGELDGRFHRETLRAQAIAARTFAWYQMRTVGRRRGYDLTATEASQVYTHLGRLEEVPAARAAVRDTTGLVCTWRSAVGDRIFCTYYSSACGGWTAPQEVISRLVSVPPLAGNVPCVFCQGTTRFDWGPVEVTKAEVADRLAIVGPVEGVEVRQATPAGRPIIIAVIEADGREEQLLAENFRLVLDPTGRQIRSTFFTIADAGESVRLENGRGFGHGVGLCQHGAEALARRGYAAARILQHYYPGSKLRRAY